MSTEKKKTPNINNPFLSIQHADKEKEVSKTLSTERKEETLDSDINDVGMKRKEEKKEKREKKKRKVDGYIKNHIHHNYNYHKNEKSSNNEHHEDSEKYYVNESESQSVNDSGSESGNDSGSESGNESERNKNHNSDNKGHKQNVNEHEKLKNGKYEEKKIRYNDRILHKKENEYNKKMKNMPNIYSSSESDTDEKKSGSDDDEVEEEEEEEEDDDDDDDDDEESEEHEERETKAKIKTKTNMFNKHERTVGVFIKNRQQKEVEQEKYNATNGYLLEERNTKKIFADNSNVTEKLVFMPKRVREENRKKLEKEVDRRAGENKKSPWNSKENRRDRYRDRKRDRERESERERERERVRELEREKERVRELEREKEMNRNKRRGDENEYEVKGGRRGRNEKRDGWNEEKTQEKGIFSDDYKKTTEIESALAELNMLNVKKSETESYTYKETELEIIKQQYLGLNKAKKKIQKPSEKFRNIFNFEWDPSEDTSKNDTNPLYKNRVEPQLLFGRGYIAGIDVREQRKKNNFYDRLVQNRLNWALRKEREKAETETTVEIDKQTEMEKERERQMDKEKAKEKEREKYREREREREMEMEKEKEKEKDKDKDKQRQKQRQKEREQVLEKKTDMEKGKENEEYSNVKKNNTNDTEKKEYNKNVKERTNVISYTSTKHAAVVKNELGEYIYEPKIDNIIKDVYHKHWSEKTREEMNDRDWRIFREDNEIYIKGGIVPPPIRTWEESNLSPDLLKAIKKAKYDKPTPIQMQAIPIALEMRDLIGIAETGSGKTAAFVLPMLSYVKQLPPLTFETSQDGPYALVIAPSRELAIQIYEETNKFASFCSCRTVAVVGGRNAEVQAFELRKGAEIVIGTPGRIQDCLEKRYTVLNQCNYVILDEADRMMDMGFEEAVHFILDKIPTTNLKSEDDALALKEEMMSKAGHRLYRLTQMFSATMPPSVERLSRKYLRAPAYISIGDPGAGKRSIEQKLEFLTEGKKKQKLQELLEMYEPPIIVFVNQKKAADMIAKTITKMKFRAAALHGGKAQGMREQTLTAFKNAEYDILVATDVAGRGIDVHGVKLVINFDMPKDIEAYTHRIGRTGRAGMKGLAISFVTEFDSHLFYDLKQFMISSNNLVPLELANHPASKVKPGSVIQTPKKNQILYKN